MPPSSVPPALRSVTRTAFACSALVIALTVAGKAVRDGLFCAEFAPAALPRAMMAGAVLSMLVAAGAGRALRAFGPVRSLGVLLTASAAGFVLEHALAAAAPRAVALALYLHVSAVAGVVVSGFWSVVNERFDPRALRLSVSKIGLGGSVGGLVGGVAAERVGTLAGPRHALLVLAVLSAVTAIALRFLAVPKGRARAAEEVRKAALPSRYLRELSLFVGVMALGSTTMDYAFKVRAMEHFTSAASFVRFFSLFYVSINVVSFLVQFFATPSLLEQAGLGVALAGRPALVTTAGFVALLAPGLPALALLRGMDSALSGSLFRSAYEPLYTPLPERQRRSVKAVIDVTFDKAGDAAGSLLCWSLGVLVPAAAVRGATFAVVALSVLAVVLAARLYQGYVVELAESLRSGVTVLADDDIHDRTTRLTLSQTLGQVSRGQLLDEIAKLKRSQPPPARAVAPAARPPMALQASKPPRSEPAALVAALGSGDALRIDAALDTASPELTAFIIPLLARDDVGARAMKVLGGFGEHVIGQLADALLDAGRHPPAVRRRLVRVIASARSAWAASALAAALEDPDLEVRGQVVRGLEELARHRIPLPISRDDAVALAVRELARERVPPGESARQALAVLGLGFDVEAFRLAQRALESTDARLRGTALEYLENVLPEAVRSPLFTALAVESPGRPRRVERDLLEELRRAFGWDREGSGETPTRA